MLLVTFQVHVHTMTKNQRVDANTWLATSLLPFMMPRLLIFDFRLNFVNNMLSTSSTSNSSSPIAIPNNLENSPPEICGHLYSPNAWWLAYCGLHIFALRIYGGAQLLRCFHLVDHTSIMFISKWIWLVKGLFGGIKHDFFCASLPSIITIYTYKGSFMLVFFLKNTHLMF